MKSSTAPVPARSRVDASRNNERVVRAALEIFDERGVLGSMEAIAARAGVGKGTVYRCFPSRDALMGAIAASQLEDTRQLALKALAGGAAPAQALRDYVYDICEYGCSHRLLLQMYRTGELLPVIEEQRTGGRQAMSRLLARCRRSGDLPKTLRDKDFFLVTVAITTQLASDPTSTLADWRRGARLLLTSIGIDSAE